MCGQNAEATGRLRAVPIVATEDLMATCDVCGNDYDKAFRITQAGKTMTFDSFECAIHTMAPRCAQPMPGHRAWCPGWRHYLLLRSLCAGIWRQRG